MHWRELTSFRCHVELLVDDKLAQKKKQELDNWQTQERIQIKLKWVRLAWTGVMRTEPGGNEIDQDKRTGHHHQSLMPPLSGKGPTPTQRRVFSKPCEKKTRPQRRVFQSRVKTHAMRTGSNHRNTNAETHANRTANHNNASRTKDRPAKTISHTTSHHKDRQKER